MKTRILLVAVMCVYLAACGDDDDNAARPDASAATDASDAAVDANDPVNVAVRPDKVPLTDERMGLLGLPPGYEISLFASGLEAPRMMRVTADGTVYVTQPAAGEMRALRDTDGDGVSDEARVVASGIDLLHGIELVDDTMYIAGVKTIHTAQVQADGTLSGMQVLSDNLPDGGQHPRRTLGVGPDGNLYVSVGSSCNACPETNPEHATMLRVDRTTGQRTIFARGLRNTIGFDWHPVTEELWGMDHGSDHRGNDVPPEELNRIVSGNHYGWPYAYGMNQPDPFLGQPAEMTLDEWLAMAIGSVLNNQAHSAPIEMRFYDGSMFPGSSGDAFVAMHGSWNRVPPTGYEVVRIRFGEDGTPLAFEPFLQGFLQKEGDGWVQFGRPAGLATMPDGSLLVSDDDGGRIYRITHALPARPE